MNITLFQGFHWYYSTEGNLWQYLASQAKEYAAAGLTHIWLPPAYKSAEGTEEPGYAVYDLFDLGEFDQKGTVRTRYGTKDEYIAAIKALQEAGLYVIADVVLNQRLGGDEWQEVEAQKVNEENRNEKVTLPELKNLPVKFTFTGRGTAYSDFIWDYNCFSGCCMEDQIWLIRNSHNKDSWANVPETEKGNFDCVLGFDVEFRNPYVVEEIKKWGKWYIETTGIDGMRLDAVKHISRDFFPGWIDYIRSCAGKEMFMVGEYWKHEAGPLVDYIREMEGRMQLFDAPLHYNFHKASKDENFDMRQLTDGTLVQAIPDKAVTFVDNHDTQPLQSLESWVDYWFKPLAYSFILLRREGIPCVFFPDLYDAHYTGKRDCEDVEINLHRVEMLPQLLKARQLYAYGEQHDYFDDPKTIGWTRLGETEQPHSGCAVLLNTSQDEAGKNMFLGEANAGKTFFDVTGARSEEIVTDQGGNAWFPVHPRSVSVWVQK